MSYETRRSSPGGKSISGGQRQLIALTAAIASDRKLLLLDEAMSNLDPIRARSIRKVLEALPATIIEARHVDGAAPWTADRLWAGARSERPADRAVQVGASHDEVHDRADPLEPRLRELERGVSHLELARDPGLEPLPREAEACLGGGEVLLDRRDRCR